MSIQMCQLLYNNQRHKEKSGWKTPLGLHTKVQMELNWDYPTFGLVVANQVNICLL